MPLKKSDIFVDIKRLQATKVITSKYVYSPRTPSIKKGL